ncbi:MAG: virulence RhuM family protein [Bacteroidales bacterium]|nr:virulence RhuM family protein [Bacteroidales bacterium]
MEKAEIIIYKEEATESDFQIEVRVEDDTVWLTQAQMAELFQTTRNNITLHIGNVFKEKELNENSVCKDSLLTAADGKSYKTKFYNLDVIISVGYRVKSLRGTQFRIWATQIIRDFLLRGHALNNRFERIEKKLHEHDQKFELIINTGLKPTQGIFFDGQIFDAWQFVSTLIKEATETIILIDNYIDESVLALLAKRNPDVEATIYTTNITKQLETDLEKHHQQYPPIELKYFTKAHDRFLIIDQKDVYHIGASLKDLGKKWFAFSKINLEAAEILNKLEN